MKKLLLACAALALLVSPAAAQSNNSNNFATQVGQVNLATAQVTVAATATLVAAARNNRSLVIVTNIGTTATYCAGTSAVTTSNGTLLPGVAGASITLSYQGALYCIVGASTQAVTVAETF